MRVKQLFFLLLRQGLWQRAEKTDGIFPVNIGEWCEVYGMAQKQTVQGIVYDGIMFLSEECRPPQELMARWSAEVGMIEKINKQHRVVYSILQYIFSQTPAIPFLLIKGIGIADLYPKPFHRLAGDIDLWFGSREQTEKATAVLEKMRFPVERGETGDSASTVNGIPVELHCKLIELHNPFLQKRIEKYEKEIFESGKEMPAPVANHLLLSTHILKHLINQGIGVRQLCDVAMALVAFHDVTDREELRRMSKAFHIYRWNKLLYSSLVKYIGMPAEYLPFPTAANPDKMIDEIWESGNFGHGDNRLGNRPAGKWKSKLFTLRRIANKSNISFGYAAGETFWFLEGLIGYRIKELFTKR